MTDLPVLQIDDDGLIVKKTPDKLFSRAVEQTLDRAAGDSHVLAGGLLIQPFEVTEPQHLEFIEAQENLLRFAQGNASRLVDSIGGVAPAAAAFAGTAHGKLLLCICT